MSHENRLGEVWSRLHPRVNWSKERDTRLVPILPLVIDFYATLLHEGTDDLVGDKLKRIGDVLIPHAQSLKGPINIADFVQIGTTAEIRKKQYWSYALKIPAGKGKEIAFDVERTDVWNGGGVSLNIAMYKDEQFCLGVMLQKNSGLAVIGAGRDDRDRHEIAFQKATWRNGSWKAIELR